MSESKQEERRRATRQKVLEAASRVFVERGYHAPLIADIVAEAGVGQGTFYRYFDSKRQVIEILLDEIVGGLLSQFVEMSESLPDSAEAYRRASEQSILRVAEAMDTQQALCSMFLREGPSVDSAFAEKLDGILARFAELAQFFLEHAITNGFARPCRADVVAQALVGMALRLFEARGRGLFSDLDASTLVAEGVALIFQGIGPETAEG